MKIKTVFPIGALGGLAMATSLLTGEVTLRAQDGPPPGSFSPTQMRQRMLERIREQFEVTDDSEWKLIVERITKVLDARRAAGGFGGPGGPFGGQGGPPPMIGGARRTEQSVGGPDAAAEDSAGGAGGPPEDPGPSGPPPGEPPMFNREPNPQLEALRGAIEAKASAAELKNKIAQLRTAQAAKQAELKKAQDELKQLLSTRQEAIAVTFGLL